MRWMGCFCFVFLRHAKKAFILCDEINPVNTKSAEKRAGINTDPREHVLQYMVRDSVAHYLSKTILRQGSE